MWVRPATLPSSFATMPATRTSSFRHRTPPGKHTTATADTASTMAVGAPTMEPTLTRSVTTDPSRPAMRPLRTGFSTPSIRCSVSWSATATMLLTPPTSTPIGAENLILNHNIFISSGHDEYWSAGQRKQWKRPAMPVSTWRSSAETKYTGKRVGRRAQTDRTRITGRSSHIKKATPRAVNTTTAYGNFDCDPDPTVWTGLWRQNQTGHDGGQPGKQHERQYQLG